MSTSNERFPAHRDLTGVRLMALVITVAASVLTVAVIAVLLAFL